MHELIPIVLFISLFSMIFGIYYMRTRENMAMLEKGLNPREGSKALTNPFYSLKYGLLLAGAGLGLFAAFMCDAYLPHLVDWDTTPLYISLLGIGGGLGLIISYMLEKKHWNKYGNKQ